MLKRGHLAALLVMVCLTGIGAMVARTSAQSEPTLHIGIP